MNRSRRTHPLGRFLHDIIGTFTHLAVQLASKHDPLSAAPLSQPATHDLLCDALARPPSVHIGRVEEVDAQLQRPVHYRSALVLARQRTEVHGTKTQAADLQTLATDMGVFDRASPQVSGSAVTVFPLRRVYQLLGKADRLGHSVA